MSNAYVDPWYMLNIIVNNVCLHVYSLKSLFIVENRNVFFYLNIVTPPVTFEFIELVPS